jgi:hypothetical protein
MGPSLHFLKLGGSTFDTLYKHFPPIIAHVLKVGRGKVASSRLLFTFCFPV